MRISDWSSDVCSSDLPVGGVSPFGLASALPIYCDESLRSFPVVIPAAGATNAALRIEPGRMAEITGAEWVDVCQGPARERKALWTLTNCPTTTPPSAARPRRYASRPAPGRSEEHTSELQSLMRRSDAVF